MTGCKFSAGDYFRHERTGTLLWVETVSEYALKVVVLPAQDELATEERSFVPGSVRGTSISPFCAGELVEPSSRNREFIESLEQLRADHGLNHVDQRPEDHVPVTKKTAKKKAAAAKKPLPKKPAPKKPVDVDDEADEPSQSHVEPPKAINSPPRQGKAPGRPRRASRKYHWVDGATLVKAAQFNDKYAPGNRGERIAKKLMELKTFTVEEAATACERDPNVKIKSGLEFKLVQRAINQLKTEDCGTCLREVLP